MNIRNEIKAYIVREGFTMSELVEKWPNSTDGAPASPTFPTSCAENPCATGRRWNWLTPSAMTWSGRSGDKEGYGKRKDQRNLFQGHGQRT